MLHKSLYACHALRSVCTSTVSARLPATLGRRALHNWHRAGKDLYIEPRPGLLLNMRHVIWIKHEENELLFCMSDHKRACNWPVSPLVQRYASVDEARKQFARVLMCIQQTPP